MDRRASENGKSVAVLADNTATIGRSFRCIGYKSKGEVQCSFWFEQQERKRPTEAFFVVVKGANGDSWEAFNTINRSCHFSGDSIRFSARFTPLNLEAEHRFVVKRPKNGLNNVALHHAMLRPTSVNVVDSLKDGFYRVNNHIPSSTVLPSPHESDSRRLCLQ